MTHLIGLAFPDGERQLLRRQVVLHNGRACPHVSESHQAPGELLPDRLLLRSHQAGCEAVERTLRVIRSTTASRIFALRSSLFLMKSGSLYRSGERAFFGANFRSPPRDLNSRGAFSDLTTKLA